MNHNSEAGLLITGHTDSKGSDEYNQALGYRRAQSVKDYFEDKGIPAGKITIDSKGEKEPAENNSTEEGRAKNRRASVTIKCQIVFKAILRIVFRFSAPLPVLTLQ